jgi:glucose-6-phosphate isomerase
VCSCLLTALCVRSKQQLMASSGVHMHQVWRKLKTHASDVISNLHLAQLLQDEQRCTAFRATLNDLVYDYARQRATPETLSLLIEFADASELGAKIDRMFQGEKINLTEDRAVLHVALRAPRDPTIWPASVRLPEQAVSEVHDVLAQIERFSERIRKGREWVGATGKPLTDVVSIGIGGSYLGPEFVYEALRTDHKAAEAARGRRLRFLANVDPTDVHRALDGLNPETTLVVVVSKTFTTAETMLNARTLKRWLMDALGESAVAKHMVAVSTNTEAVKAFGIDPQEGMFRFWDWVGGRFSVCSAVGLVPLSLQYGFGIMREFLAGAHEIDWHFATERDWRKNIPVLMGLFGVWNASFLGYSTRALLPYAQALLRFAPHIQQVDMESNGKGVDIHGEALIDPTATGVVDFGEPGTNGQHSFYQLMHQGRVIPADFVGFRRSQTPIVLEGEPVSNHDELMSNFFAQPDALAIGKTREELVAEGVPEALLNHKIFPGNRPSSSMLFDCLDARTVGRLLALYEHRAAVEGFLWNLNSFDQWGVELGKVLAKRIRNELARRRQAEGKPAAGQAATDHHWNASTRFLLDAYFTPSTGQ